MSKLRIAKGSFSLPLEAVTQTIAILAKRGAGKSYAASVLVEEMLDKGLMPVVIDPLGVWWGLQSSADGKSEGYPITVLGGDHGNVPLEPTSGAVIADFVTREQHPVVLDLSHFNKADQIRFATAFAERLYHKNRDPLHLVVDEADLFAPQASPRGYEARMLGAMEDLARRGRARGIGMTLVTQRSAVLNKNVLTQIEVLMVMRTTSPQDRKAIKAWVDVHGEEDAWREMDANLPKLPIGTAYLWSPGWLDEFRLIDVRTRKTFDSSATPKVGQRRVEPKKRAEVDLEALSVQIADTIERAKKEDPAHLRQEITRLESELAQATSATPEPVEREVEVPVFPEELRRAVRELLVSFSMGTLEKVTGAAKLADELIEKLDDDLGFDVVAAPEVKRPPPPSKQGLESRSAPRQADVPVAEGSLSKAPMALLTVLVSRHPMKLTRSQLSTLSGYKPRSSTYANGLSALRTQGLMEEEGKGRDALMFPSDAGFKLIGDRPIAPKSSEQVRQDWLNALPPTPRLMLEYLISVYPREVDREELGQQTGRSTSSSTFANGLSALRKNGLIEDVSRSVRASGTLFD